MIEAGESLVGDGTALSAGAVAAERTVDGRERAATVNAAAVSSRAGIIGDGQPVKVKPVCRLGGFLFELVIVAGDLDLVFHGKSAPGVDAIFHQKLFDVVFPGLAGAFLPGGGTASEALTRLKAAESRGGSGHGRDDKAGGIRAGLVLFRLGVAFYGFPFDKYNRNCRAALAGRRRLDAVCFPEG